jgi:hypothetical protein
MASCVTVMVAVRPSCGLQRLFDPFGTIVHYKLVLDKRDLTSKGYGFIKYEREEQARAACDAMNGVELWGAPPPCAALYCCVFLFVFTMVWTPLR